MNYICIYKYIKKTYPKFLEHLKHKWVIPLPSPKKAPFLDNYKNKIFFSLRGCFVNIQLLIDAHTQYGYGKFPTRSNPSLLRRFIFPGLWTALNKVNLLERYPEDYVESEGQWPYSPVIAKCDLDNRVT